VKPDFTFRETLEAKLRLQQDYLRGEERGERREERKERTPLLSPEGEEEPPLGEVWRGSKPSVEEILSLLMEQVERHTAHSREVLSLLKQRMPLVLVSNFYGNIHTVLREFGLDGLFTHVVESAVVGVRKPDPRIFTLGVEALGLAPYEVTVVGDSMEKDIVPARQAGCHTVWLQGEQWSSAPVDTSAADRIITDIEQLL
jgi:putative hydrolase of the HAD superfamily